MSEAARTAVLRRVLIRAKARYEREKVSPSNGPEGVIEHWSNPVVGDLAFYETVLKPIIDELDAAEKKIALDIPVHQDDIGECVAPQLPSHLDG